MKTPFQLIVAGIGLSLMLSAPATGKPARHGHCATAQKADRGQADRRYAQSYYDYRSQSTVREEFRDVPLGYWMHARRGRYEDARGYRERGDGLVVENLRGAFSGGVGYGDDGFTDGYGQTHYFVGSFRQMNPLPHGPYRPSRFMPMPARRGF